MPNPAVVTPLSFIKCLRDIISKLVCYKNRKAFGISKGFTIIQGKCIKISFRLNYTFLSLSENLLHKLQSLPLFISS